jgi:thioredoxin 1
MALQHFTESTFDAAVKAAPLSMVDFWATWCGPCKIMEPVVEKLADEYDGKALIGKVETDDEADLAEKFEIASIPTIIFFKNGAEFDRKVGVIPEDTLREILDANL